MALLVAPAGCGSQEDLSKLPAPARAGVAPPLSAQPEGRVVALGGPAERLRAETGDRLTALLREPARRLVVDARTLRVLRRLPAPPTPPGPPPRLRAAIPGGPIAELRPRERRLVLRDRQSGAVTASAPAGVGPTHVVAGDDGRVYVTDTGAEAVLLFRTREELRLVRRAGLPGRPYATVLDAQRGKLWVTLTERNEVVQLTADGQPREQRRYPTVRQPDAIAVDEPSGRVFVAGDAGGVLQAFDGYAQAP